MDAERRRTLVAGLLFLGLALVYYGLADRLPRGVLFEQIGSDVIPRLLALAMAALALLLVTVELAWPATAATEHEPENRAAFRGTLAVMALTAPLWVVLGFLATPVVMAGTMVVNGTRRPRTVLLVSAAGTVVQRLDALIREAMKDPGFQKWQRDSRMSSGYQGPADYQRTVVREFKLYGDIVAKMGVKKK